MQMSYLKIYPKRIIATLNAQGGFEGVFTLHIEQYGLQANDKKCDVKITQEDDQWQIWVQPLTGIETPQFKQFTESLNDYLFSVLKLPPVIYELAPFRRFFVSVTSFPYPLTAKRR